MCTLPLFFPPFFQKKKGHVCDFQFAFLMMKPLPKGVLLFKIIIKYEGENLFLEEQIPSFESPPLLRWKENEGFVSPEVQIRLRIAPY